MIIYKTTNLINGKIYVGQDSKNNPRYLGSGVWLNRAIEKYGKENFKKEVIDLAESKEELNEKEKYWIKFYNCKVPFGYNLTDGGESPAGYIFTEVQRQNLSKAKKGKLSGREGKKNPGQSLRMKQNNPAKRPEVREKLGRSGKDNRRFGTHRSKEEKELISKRTKEGMDNPQVKEKLKKSKSIEHKRKISETMKKRKPHTL